MEILQILAAAIAIDGVSRTVPPATDSEEIAFKNARVSRLQTKGDACSWQMQSFEPPCPETVDRTLSDTGKCSGRDPFNTLISDDLVVPASLEPGEYVLGIRWDCEKSAQ